MNISLLVLKFLVEREVDRDKKYLTYDNKCVIII